MENNNKNETKSGGPSEIELLILEYVKENADNDFAKFLGQVLQKPLERQLNITWQIIYAVCIKPRPVK